MREKKLRVKVTATAEASRSSGQVAVSTGQLTHNSSKIEEHPSVYIRHD